MALAAITTEAPKGFEEHYTKLDDGRFRLNVEASDGYALEDISGLKSALSKERANRESLERKVSDLGDLDPAEARKAMQELEELRQLDPRAEADKLAQAKIDAMSADPQALSGQGGSPPPEQPATAESIPAL